MFRPLSCTKLVLSLFPSHNVPAVRYLRITSCLHAGRINYFDVFGLPAKYDLAVNKLTPKYRELLKKFHPDRFHQKPQEEKDHSEAQSRLVNQAYRVLMNPFERGLHLLELNNSPQEEGQLDVSSDALMEVYEINDELSDTTNITRLKEIKEKSDEKIRKLIEKITEAFQSNQIEEAKKLLSQLKYYVTIEERIRSLELELGVVR